jgi:hypothetical protein
MWETVRELMDENAEILMLAIIRALTYSFSARASFNWN